MDQFLNLNGNPRQTVEWIDVDSNSGIVKQRRRVDRDTLCRDAQDCFIVLKVNVILQPAIDLSCWVKFISVGDSQIVPHS